jgi:hypothetical protein
MAVVMLTDAIEVEDYRTRDMKVFRNTRARKRIFEVGKHRHYYRYGAWRDIDLGLRPKSDNRFMVERHDIILDADSSGLAVYDYDSGKGIRFLFPRPPDRIDARAAYWTTDAVEWKFGLSRLGLKTEATVAAKRGPKTYSFSGQMLGGLAPPNPDGNGNLVQPAGAFTMPRSVAIGADGVRYLCGPWTRSGGTVSFDFDDTVLPDTALPYVIDPTTLFDVTEGDDDTTVKYVGTTYPPSDSFTLWPDAVSLEVFRAAGVPDFAVTNSFIRWDTSSLPDGLVISAASVRLYALTRDDEDGRSLTADWYTNWPIDEADWTLTAGTNAHAGTSLAGIVVFEDNDFALNDFSTNISLTGYTGVRLHISGGQPVGINYLEFSSFEGSFVEPRLVIEAIDPEVESRGKLVHKSARGV